MSIQSSAYHPMRYGRTRPFAKQFVTAYNSRFGRRRADDAVSALVPLIAEPFGRTMRHLGERATATPVHQLARELDLALTFARFTAHGRNVFSLSPALVELLAGTSLGDIRLQDIVLPFDCFYIGFAEPLAANLPGEPNRIDGAYVETMGDALLINITSRTDDASPHARGCWLSHPEPSYTIYLYGEPDQGLDSMLEQSIDAVCNAALRWSLDTFQGLHEFGLPFAPEDLIESAWAANFAVIEGRDVAAEALAIVLNALCYLASNPGKEDLSNSPPVLPTDAPEHLARQTCVGRASHREAATTRLAEGGYLPVRVLGRSIRPLVRQPNGSTGRSVSPHWRRGHPRHQAYGPGRQQHRVIRIPPTLVRADLGEPSHGRVYDVR